MCVLCVHMFREQHTTTKLLQLIDVISDRKLFEWHCESKQGSHILQKKTSWFFFPASETTWISPPNEVKTLKAPTAFGKDLILLNGPWRETCPVRPLKSNANVCQEQVLKSSVKPDSRCGCSPPSDLSPPEMNTGTFLGRTRSVRVMATGLHHPSGLCQRNLKPNNSMKFPHTLFTSRYIWN